MTAVDFPQRNLMLAEDQPEYETLPVFVNRKWVDVDGENGEITSQEIPWSMTAAFELTDEEIAEIVATRRIWHTQMLYGHPFQPIHMSTRSPFEQQTETIPETVES